MAVDRAEMDDPRMPALGFGIAVDDAEEELDFDAEYDAPEFDAPRFPPQSTLTATKSLAELEAIVAQQGSSPLPALEVNLDPRAMRDQVVVDHLPLVRAIAIREAGSTRLQLPIHCVAYWNGL